MFGWFKKQPAKPVEAPAEAPARDPLMSTHGALVRSRRRRQPILLPDFKPPVPLPNTRPADVGMDSDNVDDLQQIPIKPHYGTYFGYPDEQVAWYAQQTFIGYQLCAIMSQHWLIDKACRMPGDDAIRKGWELTANEGVEVDPKTFALMRQYDKKLKINFHLREYLRKGRIFGIRIAMFKVASADPLYYERPFNIDGVGPGAYKGIVQVDPYWIVPELTMEAVVDPSNLHFYEPEFWRVAGTGLVHRSHLCIFTTGQVPDTLKSQYFYGGVSIPQKIYERVYAAERTANEAPMLAMTKRLTVLKTDMEKVVGNEEAFKDAMEQWQEWRNNYGVKVNGMDEEIQQFDLTLTDLDAVIMTQYQLVAMIAEVPGTKLLGTQPKGFNSTGEFEESSYHETLETLQANELTPLLDRHYELMIASYIAPIKSIPPFVVTVNWNELDAMTAQEQATVNATKAETDAALIAGGAIDSQDVRDRLISDRDSGYNGLSKLVPPPPAPPPGTVPSADPENPASPDPAAAKAAPKPPMIRPKPMPGA